MFPGASEFTPDARLLCMGIRMGEVPMERVVLQDAGLYVWYCIPDKSNGCLQNNS
jgi:hypothetical protein